jgi:hypothetical protein
MFYGWRKKEFDNFVTYDQNIMSLNRKRGKCYIGGTPHHTSSHMLK